tara:strand:- start:31 stop:504 length:474 start_codon:yes stop_codon:yes gene_type:complete
MVSKRQKLGVITMNLGFYVDSPSQKGADEIYKSMNNWLEEGSIDNGNVFYNDIGFNEIQPKFGLFNSTDIWQFTGNLIITSYNAASSIGNVINKFKSAFLYTKQQEKNIMQIIHIFNTLPFIVSNKEDYDYIKRITGKEPTLMESMDLDKIKEVFNE